MDKFQEILENSKKIFIVSHVFPDWDAVCSLLSMYDYLSKAYPDKEYGIYLTGDSYKSFSFLKNFEKIQWVRDISDVIEQYDTLVFLDGNSLQRFSNEPEKISLDKFKTICIDHHPGSQNEFELEFIESNAASCSQLVYKLFFREHEELLDKEVAEVIMTGILGDSGTFKYVDHTKADTLEFAKELIEFGQFDIQTLEMRLSQFEEREFELLKTMIQNTTNVELEGKPPFTYSYLPISTLENHSIEEIKNANAKYKIMFLRQIKDHNWGFVVTPDSQIQLAVSFRSTPGSPNVQKIAGAFNGGGHIMAAAGRMAVSDEVKDSKDLCEKVVEYIRNNNLELT